MLRSALRVLAIVCAIGVSPAVSGQTDPAGPTPKEPQPSVLCMEPPSQRSKKIEFPAGEPLPDHGVVVRVRIEFAEASAEPVVQVIYNSGSPAYADAVLARVKPYRLSCLPSWTAPATFTQEFQFVPGELPRVLYSPLLSGHKDFASRCWTGGEVPPRLALSATRGGPYAKHNAKPGVLVARMTFAGPQEPPTLEVLFNSAGRGFESTVRDQVAGYRIPCMKAGDRALTVVQTFDLVFEDVERREIAAPTLLQLLGAVDKLAERRDRFDFTSMGCPFDVRLTYLQPYTSNHVAEPVRSDPHKREFVEWLEGMAIKPALSADDKLIGREFSITVPCVVLDLTS